MSRRGTAEEKTAKSDPIYRNRLVNMLVNRILKHGKIVRYEYALCGCLSFADKKEHCDSLHIETFEYENDFMKALHWYHYIPDTHILGHTKFYYKRDEDGNPVYDFCEEIDGFRNWKEQRASDDAQKNTQKEENQ